MVSGGKKRMLFDPVRGAEQQAPIQNTYLFPLLIDTMGEIYRVNTVFGNIF
jgi:hypothetical protein